MKLTGDHAFAGVIVTLSAAAVVVCAVGITGASNERHKDPTPREVRNAELPNPGASGGRVLPEVQSTAARPRTGSPVATVTPTPASLTPTPTVAAPTPTPYFLTPTATLAPATEVPTFAPTLQPTPMPSPPRDAVGGQSGVQGPITFYGASYNGRPLGCGTGLYSSANPTIAASPWSPERGHRWPCGTRLRVSGPAGSLIVIVQDACPGCEAHGILLDLSEAANGIVCGLPNHTCIGTVEVVQ